MASKPSVVVLGDLNTTEGSPYYRDLLRRAGLHDSRQGFGYRPSWRPVGFPLPLLPLDHILVRGPVVLTRGNGPEVRSDHRPIHATLAWPNPKASDPKTP
ncbi:MAG: endonuclease/exonuclease/phosphatase family protein [Planctomycetota bacterium]